MTARLILWFCLALPVPALAQETPSAERGKKTLETRAFVAASWTTASYDNLWKQWQPTPKERPADYDAAVRST